MHDPKNVIKRNAVVSGNINEINIDELVEERDETPRGSLNLSQLGWSRQIVEQFIVTDSFEKRSTVYYEFC